MPNEKQLGRPGEAVDCNGGVRFGAEKANIKGRCHSGRSVPQVNSALVGPRCPLWSQKVKERRDLRETPDGRSSKGRGGKTSRGDVTTELIYSAPTTHSLLLAKAHPSLWREIQGVCFGLA